MRGLPPLGVAATDINQLMGDGPADAVTPEIIALADRLRTIAKGPPGSRVTLPCTVEDRHRVRAALRELTSRLVDAASAEGTLIARERYVRYWVVFCDLLGLPSVMRSSEDMPQLGEFASILGMAWEVSADKRGMAHSTVSYAVSAIRVWHKEVHGIDVSSMEFLTPKICKGLKNLAGPSKPYLRLPPEVYVFMVGRLRATASPESMALADAISWCFEALFRISEVANTYGHNRAANTERYLLHDDVHLSRARNKRARKITWALQNTKQKDEVQIRSLWAEGSSDDESRDLVANANDFVMRMASVHDANEVFLSAHPERRETLPFIHVNGEALHRDAVHRAIDEGLAAAFAEGICGNPDDYRVGTHTCRRGGATLYYENGISDKTIMWLGRWVSLAWLAYPSVTDKAAKRLSGLLPWV